KPFIVPGRRTPTPPDPTPLPLPPSSVELASAPPVANPLKSSLVLPPPPMLEDQPPAPSTALPPSRVGDPVNILSLSDRSTAPSDKLVVPAGNILGATGDGV